MMLYRTHFRATILGIAASAAAYTLPLYGAPAVCSGDFATKAKLIATSRSAIWNLYPESKKVFLDGMSKDLVSFYGANTQVFYWDLLKLQSSFGGAYQAATQHLGTGPIFGDAHFGNLGEYSDKGNTYYAINDVDDVTTAPRMYDLMRAHLSLIIRFPKVSAAKLTAAFVEGYTAGPSREKFDERPSQSAKKLIPNKNVEEPSPPEAAWAAAEFAFRGMTRLSQNDFKKNCKKFVYAPFHGGSSVGLPRFRVTCNDITYELKACTSSAVDAALGINRTCNKGQLVAQLATQLSPKFVGGFVASNSLVNIREFAPFGFYGHMRTSDVPSFDDSDEYDILNIVKHFGNALSAGHLRSSRLQRSWTDALTQQLQEGLLNASGPMLQSLKQNFSALPKCF